MQIETLRKTCCGLALLLIAAGIVMMAQARFQNPKMPPGLQRPGIAMELVESTQEVEDLANNQQNRQTFHRLQLLDEAMFIPSYVLFFAAAGVFAFRILGWTRWFAAAAVLLVLTAAVFDYREDAAILAALVNPAGCDASAISRAAYWKWGLLFAMLLSLVPLLLRHWDSATLRVLGLPIALYMTFSGVAGLTGCIEGSRQQVESATGGLAAPILFFMPFVPLFYVSAMDGLNWLAQLPLLKQLVSWPEIKESKRTT